MATATRVGIDTVWTDAAQHQIFRALLQACAYPGDIQDLATFLDGAPAAIGVLAALVDQAVTLADPQDLLDDRTRRFLEARPAASDHAAYVFCDGRRPPPSGFVPHLGTIPCPDHGATLVLMVDGFDDATPLRLRGPGIATVTSLAVRGLDPAWLAARTDWCSRFPLGVDLFLAGAAAVAALPRTTRIDEED